MAKTLSSKLLYQNPWSKVYEDELEFPNGLRQVYGFAWRPNGIGAIVTNAAGEIVMVKQYRYPLRQACWELPGGGLEEGESPKTGVAREIAEETGLEVNVKEKVGTYHPLSSYSTENMVVFWCEATSDQAPHFAHSDNDEEFIDIRFFTQDQLLAMIDAGEITDAVTISALYHFLRHHPSL